MHLINCTSASVSISTKAEALVVCWCGAFRCVITQQQQQGKISNDLRQTKVVAHQSGKSYKTFPNNLESTILQ